MIETPNDWLADAIERRELSQRSLAHSTGVDTSQFGRWVRGEEQIPRGFVVELGQHFAPTDIAFLLRLKDCEDFSDQLNRRLEKLAESLAIGPFLRGAFLRRFREIVAEEKPPNSADRATLLITHLIDAAGAVKILQRVVDVNYLEPLLLPGTVARFRYPINHFIGSFLDLQPSSSATTSEACKIRDFRERLLGNLRQLAVANPSRKRWQELARQFSIHVLARHGAPADRGRVRDQLQSRPAATDPLLRRVGFAGIVLGGTELRADDRFLFQLQHDSAFAHANLFFNGFHYGDISFAADGSVPADAKALRRAVPHVLRHLENPQRYWSILNTEAWTLLQVLENAGPGVFDQTALRSRLQVLARSDSGPLQHAEAPVRKRFLQQFGCLLNNAP